MKSSSGRGSSLVSQILSFIVQRRPFPTHLPSPHSIPSDTVSDILRSIPRLLFHSPRFIGRQNTTRHRTPPSTQQRKLNHQPAHSNAFLLRPAAHRVDPALDKAVEFFYWVETRLGFTHNEMTCREMAVVFVKGNRLRPLWDFLREMSRRENGDELVTTTTITCLIKVLGEEGFADEALDLFSRMKKYHCKPDVYAYNTMMSALCRAGNYKEARSLLERMEKPGSDYPPDTFTYTILISYLCKYSMQTGCKKAIRRRMWEANHMFRLMLFKGFVPDVVTYNALIDGCCKTYRIGRALELFADMNSRGCLPNRVTYNSFIRFFSVVNEIDQAVEMLRKMRDLNHGTPTSSSYTPIIHSLCEAGRVEEAWDFLVEMFDGGSVPREFTYNLVSDHLRLIGKLNLLDGGLHQRMKSAIENRYRQLLSIKPVIAHQKISFAR